VRLLLMQLGDVAAQSDAAAVRGGMVAFADPAAVGQLAFAGIAGFAHLEQASA
jgi:hypothetical protein